MGVTKLYQVTEHANTSDTNRSYPFVFVFFANNHAWRGGERLKAYKDCLAEIEAWCDDQFGDPTRESCNRWRGRCEGIYMFANRADASAFKLRWL